MIQIFSKHQDKKYKAGSFAFFFAHLYLTERLFADLIDDKVCKNCLNVSIAMIINLNLYLQHDCALQLLKQLKAYTHFFLQVKEKSSSAA